MLKYLYVLLFLNVVSAQNNYCIEYEHLLHDTRDKYGVSWKVYNKLITNENESATFVRSIDTVFTVNEDDIIEQQASNYSQSEYKNLKKQISFSRTIFPKYNLSDSIYKINWEIKNESKAILGYNCQLAKGNFRGRTYSAYFTTEIPIKNGPQKFDGLPGIILEVVSDDKCVYYKAKSITLTQEKIENIFLDKPLISWNTFSKNYKKLFYKMENYKPSEDETYSIQNRTVEYYFE